MPSCIVVSQTVDMAQLWIRLLKQNNVRARWTPEIDEVVQEALSYGAIAVMLDGTEYQNDLPKIIDNVLKYNLHIVIVVPESEYDELNENNHNSMIHYFRRPVTERVTWDIYKILKSVDSDDRRHEPMERDYPHRNFRDKPDPSRNVYRPENRSSDYNIRDPERKTVGPPAKATTSSNTIVKKQGEMPPISGKEAYSKQIGMPSEEEMDRRVEIPLTENPKDKNGKNIKLIDVVVYTVDALFKYRLAKLKKLIIPWDEIKQRMETLAQKDLSFVSRNGLSAESDTVLRTVRQMNNTEESPPLAKPTTSGNPPNDPAPGNSGGSLLSRYLDKKK